MTAWGLSEDCLRIAWGLLLGECLTNAWRIAYECLTNAWPMPEEWMMNDLEIFNECLTNAWQLLDDCIILPKVDCINDGNNKSYRLMRLFTPQHKLKIHFHDSTQHCLHYLEIRKKISLLGLDTLWSYCTFFQAIGSPSSRFVLCSCYIWRFFTIRMIKSVKTFPFSFWITIIFVLLHKNQTPGINMQICPQVI